MLPRTAILTCACGKIAATVEGAADPTTPPLSASPYRCRLLPAASGCLRCHLLAGGQIVLLPHYESLTLLPGADAAASRFRLPAASLPGAGGQVVLLHHAVQLLAAAHLLKLLQNQQQDLGFQLTISQVVASCTTHCWPKAGQLPSSRITPGRSLRGHHASVQCGLRGLESAGVWLPRGESRTMGPRNRPHGTPSNFSEWWSLCAIATRFRYGTCSIAYPHRHCRLLTVGRATGHALHISTRT